MTHRLILRKQRINVLQALNNFSINVLKLTLSTALESRILFKKKLWKQSNKNEFIYNEVC
jgi:hypothetical protein